MIPASAALEVPCDCKVVFNIAAFTQRTDMPDCTGRIRLSSQAILLGVQALNDIARLIVDSPVSWVDLDDVFPRAGSKRRTFRAFLNGVRKSRLFKGILPSRTFKTLIECPIY